jgi:hypothetical protein
MLVSRKEKEKMVIELSNEGRTTRKIAKAVHISLKDIGKIIRKITGDEESPTEKESMKENKQKHLKSLSYYAQAFQMFKDKKSCGCCNRNRSRNRYHSKLLYRLSAINENGWFSLYIQRPKGLLASFLSSVQKNKERGPEQQYITKLLDNQNKLVELDVCGDIYNDSIKNLRIEKINLEREIDTLRKKRDNYDTLRHYKKECC